MIGGVIKPSRFQVKVLGLIMFFEDEIETLREGDEEDKELTEELIRLGCILTHLITHTIIGTIETFHQLIHGITEALRKIGLHFKDDPPEDSPSK